MGSMSYNWQTGFKVRRKSDGKEGILKRPPGWELCFIEFEDGSMAPVYIDMLNSYYEPVGILDLAS